MSKMLQPHFADPKSIIAKNQEGNGILACGTTVPTDATTGYATGCLFLHTDGGNNDALYVNEGTASSCDFNLTAVDVGIDLTGLTATVSEINQACDESANVEVVTTTNVIGASESGKTFFLSAATGFVSTLPAPAAGLRYKFIIGATAPSSGNHTVVTTSSANIIFGVLGVATVDDAGAIAASEDTITFVASTALAGDWVEVISDGTNWYVTGCATVAEAITTTQASA